MTQAKAGDTIQMHYTGTLEDGTTFDSSRGGDPLEFTIGKGQILSGVEQAAIGLQPGDSRSVKIAAQDAYGQRNEELVQTVERTALPEDIEFRPGLQLQAQTPQGQPMLLTVVDVESESVTLDANHPLAGQDLTFDIELVKVA